MNLKHRLTIIGVLFLTNANAQLRINLGVDSTSIRATRFIKFYNKYISDFTENNQVNYYEYFLKEDAESFYYPDKVAFGLLGNTSNYYLGNPRLLALDVKSDTVKAKIMFASADSLGNVSVNFIANYYVKVSQNKSHFLVTQNIETENWKQKKIRNVTFHFPSYHEFNLVKAQILIDSIISMEKNWGLEPIQIDYYFANTNAEIQAIKGFDFNFNMARSEYPSGLAYQKEKSVYCSGYGENYFHEIVHIYLNSVYPRTPLKEGIATFYGGSMGKSFQEHVIRLYDYIKEHPEINIANHREFYYVDEQTIPKYTIQALLCYLVYQKNGITGFKELLEIESLNEVYQKEFGIEPDGQNDFLREQIKKYVVEVR